MGNERFARGYAAGQAAMRERAECRAIEHMNRISNHNPDDRYSADKVAHGYGNAALNIAVAIHGLPIEPVPAERAAALSRLAEIDGPLIMDETAPAAPPEQP